MEAEQNKLARAVEIQKQITHGLTVKFGGHIAPDGDLVYVTIQKYGQEIHLSPPQAKQLADQILARIA